jgi:hypothetical protein
VIMRGAVTMAMLEVRPEYIARDNQNNDGEADDEGPKAGGGG